MQQTADISTAKLVIVLTRAYRSLADFLEGGLALQGILTTDFAILEVLLHKGSLAMSAIGPKIVAVRLTVEAKHQGDLLGIQATGRRVRWDAVDVYRFVDGKIDEEWAADDMIAILQGVGAYTPPWVTASTS